MTNIGVSDIVSIYDADPVMSRVARLEALALLFALSLLALVAAIATLGVIGVVLFLAGAAFVVPEIVVARRRR